MKNEAELREVLGGKGAETAAILSWFYLDGVNELVREDSFNTALQRCQLLINARRAKLEQELKDSQEAHDDESRCWQDIRAAELAELEALAQIWRDRPVATCDEYSVCADELEALIDKRKGV